MKGTFAGTGSVFTSIDDGGISFVRGGKNKAGLLSIDMGAGTSVELQGTIDKGSTFFTVDTYTTDTWKQVQLPDHKAAYTLNCTVYGAATPYSLSSK